jgi:clan AA aspartic protease
MAGKVSNDVGRFSVEFEVANEDDLAQVRWGQLSLDQVRRMTVRGVVDSGAAKFVLPKDVVQRLGLPLSSKVKVRYAHGRTASRQTAKAANVRIAGREGSFTAVIEPKRETALLGAIVLEDLDLLVDCQNQRLVPRDPRYAIYEIE